MTIIHDAKLSSFFLLPYLSLISFGVLQVSYDRNSNSVAGWYNTAPFTEAVLILTPLPQEKTNQTNKKHKTQNSQDTAAWDPPVSETSLPVRKQARLKVLISVHLLDQFYHHETTVLVSANLLNTTSQLSCHFYIQRPLPHETEYELSAEEDTVQQQRRNKTICLWVCQISPDSKDMARLRNSGFTPGSGKQFPLADISFYPFSSFQTVS